MLINISGVYLTCSITKRCVKMEVAPQEEPLPGNNTEDVVAQCAATNENGVEDEVQPDVVAKGVVTEEPAEHVVSKSEEEEVPAVESNEIDEVGNVEEAVVIPEVADPLAVEESTEPELVPNSQPEAEEMPVKQVEEDNAVETVDAPETEEHVTEEVIETAPAEQVEVPILEQVIVEEAPTEPTLAEETEVSDCTDRVNGMPVLTKEEEATKNGAEVEKPNEDDLVALAQSMEADEPPPSEVKETAIPPHILGHSLDADDEARNGKLRKPRLGVKIPYRNLTSQIVSKQEIADEIMERSRIRNLSAEAPEGGDIFFTKKLTKRLATKIAPTSKPVSVSSIKVEGSQKSGSSSSSSSKTPNSSGSKKVTDSNTKKAGDTTTKKVMNTSAKINDNSDLIAILEGDDDWDLMRLKSKPTDKRTPEWERETALKQLRELPKHRSYSKASSSSSSKSSPEKPKPPPPVEAVEEDPLQMDDNQEPKFSMGLVTKTYTRKRKSSEDIKLLAATILQSQKKITSDKEKKPSSSTLHSEKVSSHTKPKTYSHKPSSSTKNEMPSLKKESTSAPVTPKHSTIPTLTPNVDKSEKPEILQPQVVIAKTVAEIKTPSPAVAKTVKTPLSSPNTYISKSSRIVKKKKIWDPDEETTPKYFKVPTLKTPENVHSDTPKPSVLKPNNDKTPVIKKPSIKKAMMKKKKPKRLTEVDRLLMDEGAVNLLYAVKNTDELGNDKKKKMVISLDRAQRELKNKTNEIKNDLQINSTKDSPISLRKKEGPSKTTPTKDIAATVPQRKKSTSSANSPPASPAFYNQHAEASRIIRRHSSSSFSSENPEADESDRSARLSRKKIRPRSERNSSTFIIQHQEGDEMEAVLTSADAKYSRFSTFKVVTFPNFVQIILAPQPSGHTTLSVDSLTELRAMLHLLSNDDECSVVLLSSSGNTFCEGLNYKELYCNNRIECMNIADNYAMCVTDFLISLAQFSKILIAGIHGNAMGLGVTMLPLFDMVFASDVAKFSAPYASLGCAAEGGVLLSAPHVMNSALASELFFGSRKLTASDALRLGLVTRTFWPDKFQDELLSVLKAIADQSQQSMQAIKMQLKDHLLSDVETLLKSESSILVQHWTSKECQGNFMNYSPSK